MIYDFLYQESLKRAKFKVWVFSDLQQSQPENTTKCIQTSCGDFLESGLSADVMWYLGDAVEGTDLPRLQKMALLQEEYFSKIGVPLYYVMGNHDMNYTNYMGLADVPPTLPFWQMVHDKEGWFTTEKCSDWYYQKRFGDFTVFFLGDHIAEDKQWRAYHQHMPEPLEKYPIEERVLQLKKDISSVNGPVITVSHYPFPGGNRPSELMAKLLPLPNNVVLHLYGHAHIGDFKWAKENAYRRISNVDWHDIPQIDVSSFENIRGETCRSVLLHIHSDNSIGIFFRDHDTRSFTECYFPSIRKYPNGWDKRPTPEET